MARRAALPFHLRRSDDEVTAMTVVSRTETVHGLLTLHADRLVLQWRRDRRTEHVGMGIRSEREVEPVKETELPLRTVGGGRVETGIVRWFTGPRFVLVAADLKAFDRIAGAEGLELDHPAELSLSIRRKDRLLAEEFAAELALALASLPDRPAVSPPDSPERLPRSSPSGRSPDPSAVHPPRASESLPSSSPSGRSPDPLESP